MGGDLSGMYKHARDAIAVALAEISRVEADDESGAHLRAVTQKLQEIAKRFEEDIEFLDGNAEWETFTVAFFGETNAGKSTIVESLRIIFDEVGRRDASAEKSARVDALEVELRRDADALVSELQSYGGGLSRQLDGLAGDIRNLAEASVAARKKAMETAARVTAAQARVAKIRFRVGLGCGLAAGIAAGLGAGVLML